MSVAIKRGRICMRACSTSENRPGVVFRCGRPLAVWHDARSTENAFQVQCTLYRTVFSAIIGIVHTPLARSTHGRVSFLLPLPIKRSVTRAQKDPENVLFGRQVCKHDTRGMLCMCAHVIVIIFVDVATAVVSHCASVRKEKIYTDR